jgi:hypothetical protein
MVSLQVELHADDPAIDGFVVAIGSDQVVRAKPDHFEGDINVINLLVQLTTSTIPIVAVLIAQHIRAQRYIRVKFNGIEVRGENLNNIEAFLTKVALPAGAARPEPSKDAPAKVTKAASTKSKRKGK